MDNLDTSQLTPEMIDAIIALNGQQSEKQRINRQYAMANAMRRQGQEGMGATSPGGGRVGAPNWAGALANVYAAKKAGDMDAQARTDTTTLGGEEQGALKTYFMQMQRQQAEERARQRAAEAARNRMQQTPSTGMRGTFVDDGFS